MLQFIMGVEGNHNLYPSYKAEIHKWLPNLVGARKKKNHTHSGREPKNVQHHTSFLSSTGEKRDRERGRNAKKESETERDTHRKRQGEM